MVDERQPLDSVFHALANEARREMVERLKAGDLTVSQLAEPLAMSLAAASKHVAVLERAGILRRTVEGRRHVCRLEPGPIASARDWLGSFERSRAGRPSAPQRLIPNAPFSEEVD
jgi:DNA-binding transcriptional ArsR family regulator